MQLFLRFGFAAGVAASLLSADVTFQQTTKFKGGALIDMVQKMASMPLMGRLAGGNMKQAFEDQNYNVFIKGNKMARIGTRFSTIYDLDAGTVTNINNDKQSYSTETFDEISARLADMQKRMNRGQGTDLQFDVKVEKTGKTQTIDGENATETLLILTAKQAASDGQMVVTAHMWLVPVNPLRQEVRDFQKRLGEKFASAMGGASPTMGSAGAGMAAAAKEMSKMNDGFPVLSEVVVTGLTSAGGPMGAMGGGNNINPNTPMLDTETSDHGLVKGVADDSKFAVPAGYKEEKARRR